MQAVEFKSTPHDNVVDLPPDLAPWNGRKVRVILLAEDDPGKTAPAPTFKAISLNTRGFKFDREEANDR
ncbi:MAG: hypothetical protein H6935_02945 [Thiobacillus sp.]|nr:hypothetical protein [Thiobacillus sp.]